MNRKQWFAVSMVAGFIAMNAEATQCHLPRGEVDYLESRLVPGGTEGASHQLKTRMKPSKDCKTVRIWQYFKDKNANNSAPTDEQCQKIQGSDFSPFPGFANCTDFHVYGSEKSAQGKSVPHAFVKNGALVTRKSSPNLTGVIVSVYLFQPYNNRIIGMSSFDANYVGAKRSAQKVSKPKASEAQRTIASKSKKPAVKAKDTKKK